MRQKWMWLIVIFFLAAAGGAAGTTTEDQDRGAADMILEGGSRGEVPFPHRRHQEALEDECRSCHDLFPQKKGSIETLKAEGKLEPKQVMNKLCTNCHRKYRREGIEAGPTTCSQCHHKE
ncbi:MAG: cytochrome c3 family protein [Desulfobacterales bacterium]|jgi:hypothetical protein